MFVGWGYTGWFALVIGGAEVLGALLLVVPRFASYAASMLIVIMLGAMEGGGGRRALVSQRTQLQVQPLRIIPKGVAMTCSFFAGITATFLFLVPVYGVDATPAVFFSQEQASKDTTQQEDEGLGGSMKEIRSTKYGLGSGRCRVIIGSGRYQMSESGRGVGRS